MVRTKPIKKTYSRDDTYPVAGKKRSHAEGRSAYEPALRKHLYSNNYTSAHTARERKERNYERERMKLVRGTEF